MSRLDDIIDEELDLRGVEEWRLATRLEPFLEWLDESATAVGTEDMLAVFMQSDVGTKMPATLKNDLRAAGWLAEAAYAESVGFR